MVTRRRRFFSDSDRARFYAAIKVMREACIDVRRAAPIGGLDYQAAGTIMEGLNDATEALTGDRAALWLKLHGGRARIEETPLKPVEESDRGRLDSVPALSQQLGDFVIEQGALGDRVVRAWQLFDASIEL